LPKNVLTIPQQFLTQLTQPMSTAPHLIGHKVKSTNRPALSLFLQHMQSIVKVTFWNRQS